MSPEIILPIASAIIAGLVSAVALLYRALDDQRKRDQTRIDQLERELTEERRARNETANDNIKWALELQEKSHDQIAKLTGIAEAMQRRGLRG
jgi:hypothetical protein